MANSFSKLPSNPVPFQNLIGKRNVKIPNNPSSLTENSKSKIPSQPVPLQNLMKKIKPQ